MNQGDTKSSTSPTSIARVRARTARTCGPLAIATTAARPVNAPKSALNSPVTTTVAARRARVGKDGRAMYRQAIHRHTTGPSIT